MYDYKEMFKIAKLPVPLSTNEIYDLVIQARNGNNDARDKIALHNIRLVINIVLSRFNNTCYEIEELISVGLIGLVNAIDTFDVHKNNAFSSYAGKCVENEIHVFMKKKRVKEDSLEDVVYTHKDGEELHRIDLISLENEDVASYYEKIDLRCVVRNVIDELNGRDREIIKLYFGFYDDRQYSQNEIALMMGMTRSNVSRIMQYSLQYIGDKLIKYDILHGQFNVRNWVYNSKSKNVLDNIDTSSLNTLYGYFHNYKKEQVDMALSMLEDEDINLLSLRYDNNLNCSLNGDKLMMSDLDKIYGVVMPKIRNLLNSRVLKRVRKR